MYSFQRPGSVVQLAWIPTRYSTCTVCVGNAASTASTASTVVVVWIVVHVYISIIMIAVYTCRPGCLGIVLSEQPYLRLVDIPFASQSESIV